MNKNPILLNSHLRIVSGPLTHSASFGHPLLEKTSETQPVFRKLNSSLHDKVASPLWEHLCWRFRGNQLMKELKR